MAVTLRPLTKDNRTECLALSVSDEEMNHSQLGTMREIVDKVENDPNRVGLAIYSEEGIVGFTDYASFPESNEYHIYDFLIDENQRRRGYGEAALRLLVAELCQKPDCEKITLSYMSFNDTGAIELYEKVGFVEQEAEDDEPGDRYAALDCR